MTRQRPLLSLVETATLDPSDPDRSGTVRLAPTESAATMLLDASGAPEGDDPTAEIPKVPVVAEVGRYTDLGAIGFGGMGEVRRVRDNVLHRVMAMKIVRRELADVAGVVARFVEEAQATAQLEHPGIVPVHDLGRLADGRWFFTMKEVRGRTFGTILRDVLRASAAGRWEATKDGFTLHRVIDAFRKVCEAVAYAHARGVVHRDLKPDNVLVGEYGEVLVVDWGLAKILGVAETLPEVSVVTDRSEDGAHATRLGTVAGTPAYMAPEQASGDVDRIGPPTDVFALGTMLHEALVGRGSYAAPTDLPVPAPLREIAEKARQPRPEDRYPDAGALARDVAAWLEGARRREQALELVDRAGALGPEVERLHARARDLRADAQRILDAVKPHEPVESKRPAWALQDEAARCEREAALAQVEANQLLRAALSQVPDLAEAHDALATYYRARHAEAEARRDANGAAQYEALLRAHDTGRHAGYLRGDGALTLITDPPGAEVRLFRYEERDRRLVPVFVRALGRTPLKAVDVPMGSWLLEITARGRATVRYPVRIDRQAHWDGLDPSGRPVAIALPRRTDLDADDVCVPAGWCAVGGDDEAIGALPARRLWVDAFVIRRFPVTRGEYRAFLDDLVAQGREDEALRHAPRRLTATSDDAGALLWRRDADGRFHDDDRDDKAVTGVDWHGARAYSRWLAAATGLPWRLPGDVEWEKAARGVDGRFFPWGDFLDPTFCCFMASHAGHPEQPPVDSFPLDESPYGVRGLGGDVRDWCEDAYERNGRPVVDGRVPVDPDDVREDVPRVIRGGCWSHHDRLVRAATRWWETPTARTLTYGFRVVRPL